jgi:hypothetical protein
MRTVRLTVNVDQELLRQVVDAHPGVTKAALVERGFQALLARGARRAGSPLDVPGIALPLSTDEIVALVHAGRRPA